MLTENKELYKKMEAAIKNMHCEIHAVYEPDGSDFLGDCYCAAVDLFSWQFTFRIYFKLNEAGEITVEHIERWRFG